MTRVLVVEDDEALARGVQILIRDLGHAVDVAAKGEDALAMTRDEPYGLVVLDLGLPDMVGFDVLSRLRSRGDKVPILILTARDAVHERVRGLDLGGDDYLLKPFDPTELTARIRALIRRANGEASPSLTIGSLTIDWTLGQASVSGRPLELRRREWAVLERLAARAGKIVPKDRLAAEVFSFDEAVAPNAIEVYVARLRKKLEPDGPRIRTMRGLGYMLIPNDPTHDAAS